MQLGPAIRSVLDVFALIGDVFRALRIKPSLASDPYWQLGARRRGVRAVFVPTCVIGFISATQTELTAAFSWVLSQGPPVLHTRLLFYYLGWKSSIRKRGHFIIRFLIFGGAILNHSFQQSSPDSLHGVIYSVFTVTLTRCDRG